MTILSEFLSAATLACVASGRVWHKTLISRTLDPDAELDTNDFSGGIAMLRRPSSEVLVIEISKDAGAAHGIAFEDRGMWPFPDLLCLRQMHVAVSRVDRDSKAAESVEPGMEILSINGAEPLKAWHCDDAIRKAGGIVQLKVRKPAPALGLLGLLGVPSNARLPWTRRKLTVRSPS